MTQQFGSTTPDDGQGPDTSHDRLEDLAWAAFLISTGVIWLLPTSRVPEGAWLIATGLILLALNLARYIRGRAISSFTTLLGLLAVVGGSSALVGLDLPLLALSMIALGLILVFKPALRRRTRRH